MQDRLRKLMEGSSFAMCKQQAQEIKIGIKGLGAAGGEKEAKSINFKAQMQEVVIGTHKTMQL